MNERANELIKSIPDLRYDASTGMFETDRRALYDLVELTIRECALVLSKIPKGGHYCTALYNNLKTIKQHFGVEE